ncbi:MAG TPA: sulfur carrier protein ThiS, partial [Phycisphaerae bacterium]|nr:sulfur carrier protein ThiS [Phycisphaerae bacterium]
IDTAHDRSARKEIEICIRLNGELMHVPASTTLAALVAIRSPRPPFAVEVNKSLVRRPHYESTLLREGDIVEIVTLVGGG